MAPPSSTGICARLKSVQVHVSLVNMHAYVNKVPSWYIIYNRDLGRGGRGGRHAIWGGEGGGGCTIRMCTRNYHIYTHLILTLGIVSEPTVWGCMKSKYSCTHVTLAGQNKEEYFVLDFQNFGNFSKG